MHILLRVFITFKLGNTLIQIHDNATSSNVENYIKYKLEYINTIESYP